MIEPRDEHPHPAGSEPAWSESYYFNFVDTSSGVAGLTRIGFRPNEGTADGNLFVFLPGGAAVAVLNRDRRSDVPEDVSVGGLRYERGFDLRRWIVECTGTGLAVRRAGDLDMTSAKAGGAGGKIVPVRAALTFVATMPPFGTSGRNRRTEDAEAAAAAVAAGHFEQACRVNGFVKAGGQRFEVKGFGLRDKSWGPRDWSAPWGWRWFSIPFDRDLAIGVHAVMLPGREVQAGWVWRDNRTIKMQGFELDTTYDGPDQQKMRIAATDVEGNRYEIDGEVRSVIPIRIGSTRVAEGLTEFRMGDRTTVGIAEYLDNR